MYSAGPRIPYGATQQNVYSQTESLHSVRVRSLMTNYRVRDYLHYSIRYPITVLLKQSGQREAEQNTLSEEQFIQARVWYKYRGLDNGRFRPPRPATTSF